MRVVKAAAVQMSPVLYSREATVAFLISTPETGEEAILITYGLLGPVMAVARLSRIMTVTLLLL